MEFSGVIELLQGATASGAVPGGVIAVGDRKRQVWEHAFGRIATTGLPPDPVTLETRYDVASITKVAATTAVAMRLHWEGQLRLDREVRDLVPAFGGGDKDRVQLRHLLSHSSGLPAHVKFYERVWAGDLAGAPTPREAVLRMAATTPLEAAPGERSVYSDLGFIVLGAALEAYGGARLDALARELIYEPLGMHDTGFVPLPRETTAPGPGARATAPTEVCPRRGLVHGEVHDENCHAAGGVLGHAGLFSTVHDLSRFACAMVDGSYPPGVDREFLRPAGIPGSTWRLGWDGPSPTGSQAGEHWPKTGSGHLGFTGCSIWIDPARGRWVVMLTNRVHPTRTNEAFKLIRPRIHDAVVAALG